MQNKILEESLSYQDDYLIIGSCSLNHYFKDFKRDCKDIDLIYSSKKLRVDKSRKIDAEYFHSHPIFNHQKVGYLKPNLLLTLKASHLFWDFNFNKHLYDVIFLLKKGYEIDYKLFYQLYKFWNLYHTKLNYRSQLNMSAKDFFNNALKCEYNHDYLHTLIKDVPTYTKILCDNEEVKVSESKFNELSHDDKISLVKEEVFVMSFERYSSMKYYHAYYKMLCKFLISHAPLWEALFMIENWIELSKKPENYFKTINNKLNENR